MPFDDNPLTSFAIPLVRSPFTAASHTSVKRVAGNLGKPEGTNNVLPFSSPKRSASSGVRTCADASGNASDGGLGGNEGGSLANTDACAARIKTKPVSSTRSATPGRNFLLTTSPEQPFMMGLLERLTEAVSMLVLRLCVSPNGVSCGSLLCLHPCRPRSLGVSTALPKLVLRPKMEKGGGMQNTSAATSRSGWAPDDFLRRFTPGSTLPCPPARTVQGFLS
jgi:hypothetical protein